MTTTHEPATELWAILEIMGHQRYAGRITEQTIAGTNLLRVDVPETDRAPAFSKLFGTAAIYGLTPVSEETARAMAAQLLQTPMAEWDVRQAMRKLAG